MSDFNTEAKATFKFVVGDKFGTKTVGATSPKGKNDDDWKISLALDAGRVIAEEYNTGISAISLSLVEFQSSAIESKAN